LFAQVQVGFVESLKLGSRFFACFSVCGGFDWLCFVASVLFVVGFARFPKSGCLFLAKVLAKIQVTLFQQAFGQHKISSLQQSFSFGVLIGMKSGF
jgi:hypothetical protein